jgi:hypothetical protein
MENVLRLIAEYQWWLYGLFGLILLFYLRRALVARRGGARSIFTLEQEQARIRYRRSVMMSAIILLIVAAVFVLSNPVLPGPNTPVAPTVTETTGPLAASTLTATPPPPTITPTSTATKERPTRPPRPTETPDTEATETPEVRPPNCPDPNVRITSPGVNQVVIGNFSVRGTANIPSFQYYKIEVGPGSSPRDHEWTVVGPLHHSPVIGGVLGTFNSGDYPPGTYTLRLVVVDQTGNYPAPCNVTLSVQR